MNSLNRIDRDWREHAVFSEDPYNSLWRELLHFAGKDAADRALSASPDQSQHARFRNAIKLADEFWVNFEDADERIDAVPLHYGTLWLGMACAYATLSPSSLANIEPGHGLSFSLGPSPRPFLNSRIGAAKVGTFPRINEAFGGAPFTGQVSVGTLIEALPLLLEDLRKVDRRSAAIGMSAPGWHGGDLEESLFPPPDCVATFSAAFPLNAGSICDNAAVGEYLRQQGIGPTSGDRFKWVGKRQRLDEIEQLGIRTPFGLFLLPRIGGVALPEFSIYLMLLYAMSMLVRYYPDTWIPMTQDQTDEHFVLRSFILYAKTRVPELALNHLTNETWAFRSRD